MASQDFNSLRRQIDLSLKDIDGLYSQWQGASEAEAKRLNARLLQDIGDVRWDLDDLEKSLTASKSGSDRGKVSVADVEQRTTFITQSRQRLTQVQNALSAAAPTRPTKPGTAGGSKGAPRTDGGDMHAAQRQEQAQILKEQDLVLDRFHDTVTQIGTMTKQIGGELEEQNTILEEFDYEVADTQGRLSNATKFVDKLLENASNNKSWVAIIVLFVILLLVIIIAWAL